MKTISWTLRASLVAAILATVSNAFALEGLFDCFKSGTSDSQEFVVDDGSFFGGDALTIGGTSAPFGAFAMSETSGNYSECAGCNGGGIPAAVSYDACCDSYCDSYETGWVEYPTVYRPYRSFRPVRNILSGVKNFLFGSGYQYCQPAYVCDPCWSVCDDCWSPCSTCEVGCETSCCGANEVYAPRGCCGDGFAPGETRSLNPQTALPGIDSSVNSGVSPNPTPIQSDGYNAAPTQSPAIPAAQPVPAGASETVPTPAADSTLGSGVLQMLVPEDAVVYVNGYRTRQSGTVRSFAANNLEYGETYSFEIRVVAVRDGRRFEDVQNATLTAGETSALAFNLSRVRDNEAVAVNR